MRKALRKSLSNLKKSYRSLLDLSEEQVSHSRSILRRFGNMSSATLMFVLADLMDGPPIDHGVGLAFGPGLAAEGFAFQCG